MLGLKTVHVHMHLRKYICMYVCVLAHAIVHLKKALNCKLFIPFQVHSIRTYICTVLYVPLRTQFIQ